MKQYRKQKRDETNWLLASFVLVFLGSISLPVERVLEHKKLYRKSYAKRLHKQKKSECTDGGDGQSGCVTANLGFN